MAIKKGEGVRGVLGDLVSKDRERKEQPAQPAMPSEPVPLDDHQPEPLPRDQEEGQGAEINMPPVAERPYRKAIGIKGRPRVRKDEHAAFKGEKTKVTLSIDEQLREQFYRLAHGEMMQPGEFVERALRYYIKHQAGRV